MENLNTEYIKFLHEQIEWNIKNIKKYDNDREDFTELRVQVASLSDIFHLISEEQKFELLAPVEQALREL